MKNNQTENEAFDQKAARALHRYDVIDRIVKRIEYAVVAMRSLQGAEGVSAIGCICVSAPLFVNPNFFTAAPYFSQLAKYVTEPTCAYFFATLGVFQVVGLLLGAEPPAFPEDGRVKLIWLRYRVCLLVVAAMVWAAMGYLLTVPNLTMWGSACVALTVTSSFSCIYLVLYHLKPTLILRERFVMKGTPATELST